ncbi:MAG: hypothetical protein HFJ81_00640 [Clostridia bacterium]|nr:hypothetical protein [Clostridia bacterium]
MKKKTLYGVIALILAAAIVIVCGVGSSVNGKWFKNKDIQTWFKFWGQNSSQEETRAPWGGVVDGDGNEMNNEATYAMPAAMAFYSNSSDDISQSLLLASPSVTVTCTHNFELNNIKVDWSVEYPSGANATDIITVTPESDGSTRATVQCSAPFDTQITLKATLRGNTEKTATCAIDYVKRIERCNSISISGTDFEEEGGLSCSTVFGSGTITGQLKVRQVFYRLLDTFEEDVQSYLKFDIAFKSYSEGNLTLNKNTYENSYNAVGEVWAYDMFIKDFENYDEAHKNAIYFAWFAAYNNGKYLQNYRSIILLDVDIDVLYNGKTLQTFSETDYIEPRGYNYLNGETKGYSLAPDLDLNNGVIF